MGGVGNGRARSGLDIHRVHHRSDIGRAHSDGAPCAAKQETNARRMIMVDLYSWTERWLGQELAHAALAQPRGSLRGGVVADERQRDLPIETGEEPGRCG